jgi:metal-responsive CopG/Arc/MetJ family transcriptional regulator
MNMNVRQVGISLPIRVVEAIDRDRGDISRSRFLLRLLEKALSEKEDMN